MKGKHKNRRPTKDPGGEAQKKYTVNIIPSLRDSLFKHYGSLSRALEALGLLNYPKP